MTGSILVVDDDPQVLAFFGGILEKEGYLVRLTASGQDALSILREVPVDVVILDLSMPEPDGFELLQALRASMPELRIIIISGYLHGALLKAAELLGAAATLSKPTDPAKLLETVRRVLPKSSSA